MKFYRTVNIIVNSLHFHFIVTAEEENAISLSSQLSDSSLGQIVVNRKTPNLQEKQISLSENDLDNSMLL